MEASSNQRVQGVQATEFVGRDRRLSDGARGALGCSEKGRTDIQGTSLFEPRRETQLSRARKELSRSVPCFSKCESQTPLPTGLRVGSSRPSHGHGGLPVRHLRLRWKATPENANRRPWTIKQGLGPVSGCNRASSSCYFIELINKAGKLRRCNRATPATASHGAVIIKASAHCNSLYGNSCALSSDSARPGVVRPDA